MVRARFLLPKGVPSEMPDASRFGMFFFLHVLKLVGSGLAVVQFRLHPSMFRLHHILSQTAHLFTRLAQVAPL